MYIFLQKHNILHDTIYNIFISSIIPLCTGYYTIYIYIYMWCTIYYTLYIRYDVPYNTYYKLDAMYFVIYDYTQHHILHIIYWAWGHGQDMVYTWRVNFISGLNLWNPRYYEISIIFDKLYTGDYADYILYTIYDILDTVYYRIETGH